MSQLEPPLIIVTGATGQLGGLIVKKLLAYHPAERIVATTRVPEQADELRALGCLLYTSDAADE